MWLVFSAMRRPITILVAVISVALASILAVRQMKVDIFPKLGAPAIYVAQPYGGMDPSQMEGYLTYYYEYHFLYIWHRARRVQVHSGRGHHQIAIPSRHGHVPSHVRDRGVRQSRPRVHAARHRAAVHHAFRCRQRARG